MQVALGFCADSSMEMPLPVAIGSVSRSLASNVTPHIYVIDPEMTSADERRLDAILAKMNRRYKLTIQRNLTTDFHTLPAFHGSHACYFRLLLPEFVKEDRVLYLDLDTVTTCDVSSLFVLDMKGAAVGFVVDGKCGSALESEFLTSLGAQPNEPYFNSGVMLIDIYQWKQQRCFDQVVHFAAKNPEGIEGDQTILNALFRNSCVNIDKKYNIKLNTWSRHVVQNSGIFHFVGSPKPWDLFGDLVHPNSDLWLTTQHSVGVKRQRTYTDWRNWKRFPRIAGGYVRSVRRRWSKKS